MADPTPRTYEQMTLTERAELHILAARMRLSDAQNAMLAANNQLPGLESKVLNVTAAAALWAGAQAEATLANACALLAANEGSRPKVEHLLKS